MFKDGDKDQIRALYMLAAEKLLQTFLISVGILHMGKLNKNIILVVLKLYTLEIFQIMYKYKYLVNNILFILILCM